MNAILDDDALTRLLAEAAESFPVPEEGPSFVLEELAVTRPRSHRAVKWGAAAAAVIVGILVVQSLGSGGSPSKKAELAAPAPAASRVDQRSLSGSSLDVHKTKALSDSPYAATPGVASGTGSATAGGASAGVAGVMAPAAPSPLPATLTSTSAAAPVGDGFSDSAKIVKTGTVALIVGDGKVSTVITKITGLANGVGGYISSEKSQEYGDDPSSTVTMRIPVSRFETVVQSVRDQVKNGVGKVDSSSTSGQDVTAQYADVNAQIQSLTAARDRFLVILERANTIGETLSVQQRVDSVQQQIDSLKGRMRVLRDQTSMGTLTVTVSEKAKAETKPHVQSGLSRSFDNAKHGFTSGVESMISKSGKGLLVLIVALVCLVILRTGWRLTRRRFV